MKHLSLAAMCAALSLAACTSQPKFSIEGTTTQPDGTMVYLRLSDRQVLDSVAVKAGHFSFAGAADSLREAMITANADVRPMMLYLEPGTIVATLETGDAMGTPLNDDITAFGVFMDGLQRDLQGGLDEDSLTLLYQDYVTELSVKHQGDPLGLNMVKELAYYMTAEQIDSIRQLCPLYANDARLQKYYDAKKAEEATTEGMPYIDIKGINAKTGEEQSLSDILAEGLPVIVDFWASWCGPCRREIKEYLSEYAKVFYGRCNFVGIAVWENSIDDTRKAMSELPISWSVIFAGDRTNSPADQYGITGIPQIMLISPDGTILARDLRGKAIGDAIDEAAQ